MPEEPTWGAVEVVDGVLVLTGEVDTLVVEQWRSARPVLPRVEVADLSQVTFLSCAGIALLEALARSIAPARLQVRAPSRPARRLLGMLGLEEHTDVVDADPPAAGAVPRLPARARRVGRPRDEGLTGRLLDTALDVLATGGRQELTADRLAARARTGKASIYRRWPSTSHLVCDALTRSALVPAPHPTPSVAEGLAELLGAWTRDPSRDERAAGAVLGAARHDPVLRGGIERAVVGPLRDAVAAVVAQHADPGRPVPPDRLHLVQVAVRSLWWERCTGDRPPCSEADLRRLVDGALLPLLAGRPA